MKSKTFMPLSLEKTLRYAKAAKEYARSQIMKSYTATVRLPNQELEKKYQEYLYTGVRDVRGLMGQFQDQDNMDTRLVNLPELKLFEYSVSMSSKYSVGNCREYAMQALNYVINQLDSSVFAELFSVSNGNHNILVLNRLPDSDPAKPETWGNNAVICDPWVDRVYPASEYTIGLKYCIENFNPVKHQLTPWNGYNSLRFSKENTIRYIKRNFSSEIDNLLKILKKYVDSLNQENSRIIKTYNNLDPRIVVLENKIKIVDQSIQLITDTKNQYFQKEYDTYVEAKQDLTNTFYTLQGNAVNSMQFSAQDQNVLNKPNGDNLKIQAMKFFGKKSDTQTNLENITMEANNSLSKK